MPRILINFPTNIGDVIFGLSALNLLKNNYSKYSITAIASPATRELLLANNFINEVIVFDKFFTLREKINFALRLIGKFEIIVDLKNSFLPAIIAAKKRTPFIRCYHKDMHLVEKYLILAKSVCSDKSIVKKSEFKVSDAVMRKWHDLNIPKAIFIACFSKSPIKRYPANYLQQVIRRLVINNPIVIIGEKKEEEFYRDIVNIPGVINLLGATNLIEVTYLLKHYAKALLGVDSSILHIASYLNIPVVSLFGPTPIARSKPLSDRSIVLVNKGSACLSCDVPGCKYGNECMLISPDVVVDSIYKVLEN